MKALSAGLLIATLVLSGIQGQAQSVLWDRIGSTSGQYTDNNYTWDATLRGPTSFSSAGAIDFSLSQASTLGQFDMVLGGIGGNGSVMENVRGFSYTFQVIPGSASSLDPVQVFNLSLSLCTVTIAGSSIGVEKWGKNDFTGDTVDSVIASFDLGQSGMTLGPGDYTLVTYYQGSPGAGLLGIAGSRAGSGNDYQIGINPTDSGPLSDVPGALGQSMFASRLEIQAVPEPSVMALGLLGALALGARYLKRKGQ